MTERDAETDTESAGEFCLCLVCLRSGSSSQTCVILMQCIIFSVKSTRDFPPNAEVVFVSFGTIEMFGGCSGGRKAVVFFSERCCKDFVQGQDQKTTRRPRALVWVLRPGSGPEQKN